MGEVDVTVSGVRALTGCVTVQVPAEKGHPAADAGGDVEEPCTPVTYYLDEDGDGFGGKLALAASTTGRSVLAYHRLDTSAGRLGRRGFVRALTNDWDGTVPGDAGVDSATDSGDAGAPDADAAVRDAEAGAVADATADARDSAVADADSSAPDAHVVIHDAASDVGSPAKNDDAAAPATSSPEVSQSEGCACRATNGTRASPLAVALLLAPIALARRRRRKR
jgi:MYXO-CTERM domain-containing protein